MWSIASVVSFACTVVAASGGCAQCSGGCTHDVVMSETWYMEVVAMHEEGYMLGT
jgi:hypothetical protein